MEGLTRKAPRRIHTSTRFYLGELDLLSLVNFVVSCFSLTVSVAADGANGFFVLNARDWWIRI